MGLAGKAIRGTLGFGSLNIARYVLTLGSQIVLANLLSPEIFGIVTLSITFLTFLALPMRWGVGEAILQDTDHRAVFSTVFWLRVGILVPVGIIGVTSSYLMGMFYEETVVLAFLLLIGPKGVSIMAAPFTAALQEEFRLIRLGVIKLVSVLVGGGVAVWLAVSGESLIALVAFYGIQDVIRTLGVIILSPRYPSLRFSVPTARWFYEFARPMWFSKILNSAESRGDDYLIGTLADSATLGAYSVAWRLAVAFKTVVQPAVDQAILPTFAKMKDSGERSTEALEFVLRMQLYVAIPGYILAAIVAPELITFVFGTQWAEAAPIFAMLSLTGILAPVMATFRQFYYARGEAEIVYAVQKYYVLVLVLMMLGLVPVFGGLGGAMAVNGMSFVAVALFVRRLHGDTNFSPQQTVGPSFVAGSVTALVTGMVRYGGLVEIASKPLTILAFGGIVSAVYLPVLFAGHGTVVRKDLDVIRRAVIE